MKRREKESSSIKWMLSSYMVMNHIESFVELSQMSGIPYKRLCMHAKNPEQFRLFEVSALDKILSFKDEDLVMIVRRMSA